MPPTSAVRKTQAPTEPNRRQSGRQIRTSTSRPVNYYARPFGSFSGQVDEPQDDNPPGFFPAIQYFTDAITALPKETMRHFTLMKEVEAKVHGPTQAVTQMAGKIMRMPVPPRRDLQPSRQALLSFTANNSSAATSANPSVLNGMIPATANPSSDNDEHTSRALQLDPQLDMARRQDFHNLRMVIQSILINLDEKNVCLAEANRTLGRQLARVEDVIPHVESEISEEARLGNLSHWAYADNKVKNKTVPPTAERARRDVAAANSLAAAAATVHESDIAAARSEARREAKKSRAQHADSEFEDRSANKKTLPVKSRKAAEPPSNAKGLGIVNGTVAALQPPKRRKVEKEGGVVMERTMSGAPKANNKPQKETPRSTPAAEPSKKKSAKAPPVPPLIKKRYIYRNVHARIVVANLNTGPTPTPLNHHPRWPHRPSWEPLAYSTSLHVQTRHVCARILQPCNTALCQTWTNHDRRHLQAASPRMARRVTRLVSPKSKSQWKNKTLVWTLMVRKRRQYSRVEVGLT